MAASMLDLGIRIFLALPRAGTPKPKPSGGGGGNDTTTPLSPSPSVNINGGFMTKLHDMMGVAQLGAWTVVGLSVLGCGGMMAWSWVTGKGFQALGRMGWVMGGSVIIASGTSLVTSFSK